MESPRPLASLAAAWGASDLGIAPQKNLTSVEKSMTLIAHMKQPFGINGRYSRLSG